MTFRVRGFLARGAFSANSNPTLPFSNFKCAENGRPFFEINFGRRSVLPVMINFCTCSFGMVRCRIVLLMRNVHCFGGAAARSQMYPVFELVNLSFIANWTEADG